jgi:hypothetical protein
MAINRILSRFTGNVADAANRWDVSDLVSGKAWRTACTDFLKELDLVFLSPEFFRNQMVELRRLHPKPGQGPQDFLLDFTTQARTLSEAAAIAKTTPLSDEDTIRQLLAVLPAHVRNAIYLRHDLPENIKPKTLFPEITRIWINTPAPAAKPAAPLRQTALPGAPQGRKLRYGTCNKPCWDTNPAVSILLRGPARGRDGKTSRPELDNLCWSCRRSPAEHEGTLSGCGHYGPHGPLHQQPVENRITDPSRLLMSGNE